MKKHLLSTFILLLIALVSYGQSAQLSIQGVLRNSNGTAVENGQYELTFRLYSESSPPALIWEETMSNIDVEGGIYSVVLGSGSTPLDAEFDQPYTLGVSVEGGTELIPRAKLTSSPYALSLIGNDNIFPNTGNVGVGDANPQTKLAVKRGNGILGLEALEDANNTAIISTTADGMQLDAGGPDKTYTFSNGRIDATADQQFTVAGTDTAQLILNQLNGNASLGFDASNGDDLTLSNYITDGEINIQSQGAISMTPANAPVKIEKNGEALQLIGTENAFLSFFPQGESAGRIGFFGTHNADSNINLINETTGADIHINTHDGEIHMNSYVKITTNNTKPISGRYFRYQEPYTGTWNGSANISILATGKIQAAEFYCPSDHRIKKGFSLSDNSNDLKRLKQLEVTDYQHIDTIEKSSQVVKGLIAQQVKEVFPEAINFREETIPNIFTSPASIQTRNGQAIFTFKKEHNCKVGDLVEIITKNSRKSYEVLVVENSKSFTIQNWQDGKNQKEVFVYGKEVDDFHVVNYDRVFTLNVSATQELARKVEALEMENAALKTKISQSSKVSQVLKAEMATLNERMKGLENRFEN